MIREHGTVQPATFSGAGRVEALPKRLQAFIALGMVSAFHFVLWRLRASGETLDGIPMDGSDRLGVLEDTVQRLQRQLSWLAKGGCQDRQDQQPTSNSIASVSVPKSKAQVVVPTDQVQSTSAALVSKSPESPQAPLFPNASPDITHAPGPARITAQVLEKTLESPASRPKAKIFLAIMSSPLPKYADQRDAVRRTWLLIPTKAKLRDPDAPVLYRFFIGQTDDEALQLSVRGERDGLGDIVELPMLDNYRNLTLKTVLALHWARVYVDCPYIVKLDDDVFFRPDHLVQFLSTPWAPPELYWGHVQYDVEPKRKVGDPAYVSEVEWSKPKYPQYVTGNTVVISSPVAGKFVSAWRGLQAVQKALLPLEDVQMGIWAEALGIMAQNDPKLFLCCPWDAQQVCNEAMISEHKVGPDRMIAMYARLLEKGTMCEK